MVVVLVRDGVTVRPLPLNKIAAISLLFAALSPSVADFTFAPIWQRCCFEVAEGLEQQGCGNNMDPPAVTSLPAATPSACPERHKVAGATHAERCCVHSTARTNLLCSTNISTSGSFCCWISGGLLRSLRRCSLSAQSEIETGSEVAARLKYKPQEFERSGGTQGHLPDSSQSD